MFDKHLDRAAIDIAVQDLQLAADEHPSASSAGRAIGYLKPLARWAAKRGLMQKGFHELEKPAERNTQDGGHTVLDRETLAKVLPALYEGHHGPAARMMLWTAARLDEVCSATWNEFDLDSGFWTIAAGRRKDTRSRARKKQVPAQPHIIPLPRQATSMLKEMRDRANARCPCISGRARGQIGQLGSLVEVYLRADGNERLDAPRPAKDLRHAGRGTQRCPAHHKYPARPQEPREQPTSRDYIIRAAIASSTVRRCS